jgi:hypothetical protein
MTSHDNDNGRLMTLPRRSSRRLAVSPSPPSAPLRTQAPGRAAGQHARQSSKGAPLTWPCFADRRLKRAAEPRPCTRSLCATGRLISISTSAPHPTTARAARTARTADEAAASWLSAALDWTTLGPQSCTGDVLAAHHRHVSPSQPTLDRRPSTVDRRRSSGEPAAPSWTVHARNGGGVGSKAAQISLTMGSLLVLLHRYFTPTK